MRWATPWRYLAASAVGAVLLVGIGLRTGRPGTFLCVVAAAALAAVAARDGLLRPTVEATDSVLCVVAGVRRLCVSWKVVGTIRSTRIRRVMVQSSLEVELGDELVVIPGYRLGAPPDEVAEALRALRSAAT